MNLKAHISLSIQARTDLSSQLPPSPSLAVAETEQESLNVCKDDSDNMGLGSDVNLFWVLAISTRGFLPTPQLFFLHPQFMCRDHNVPRKNK